MVLSKKKRLIPLLTLALCSVLAVFVPVTVAAAMKDITNIGNFTFSDKFTSVTCEVSPNNGTGSASVDTSNKFTINATGIGSGCDATRSVTTVRFTAKDTVAITYTLTGDASCTGEAVDNGNGTFTVTVPGGGNVGFEVGSDNNGSPESGTVTITNVTGAQSNRPGDCATFSYNNKTYYYLDKAIEAIGTNTGTIVVTGDGKLYHSTVETDKDYANKTFTFTIPAKATLLVPFDNDNTAYTGASGYAGETMVTPTAFRTLTMPDKTKIVVEGAMNVSGKYAYTNSGGQSGSPSGPLGFVQMESGSNITVKGNLYAFGYIIGSGTVTATSGSTVHEVLQMPEFRGGSQSNDMDYNVFPLSQFYVQNIEVPLTLEAGASGKTYGNIFVSALNLYPETGITLFGSGGMFELTSGSVTKWYDGSTDRLNIEINGTAQMNSVSLKVDAGILGSGTINSSKFVLPINGAFNICLKSGSSLTIPSTQDVLLQPGAQIIIEEGASCTVNSNLYIYDAAQWGAYSNWGHAGAGDSNCWDTPVIPVSYSPTRTKVRLNVFPRGLFTDEDSNPVYMTEDPKIYEAIFGKNSGDLIAEADLAEFLTLLPDASILVNGSLTGNIYTTNDGANIYSTGNGTFTQTATSNSSVWQLMMGADYSFNSGNGEYYVEAVSTPAQLKNANGSYVQSTADTYTYFEGFWHMEGCTKWENSDVCDCNHQAVAAVVTVANDATVNNDYHGTLAATVSTYTSNNGYIQMLTETTETTVGDAKDKKTICLDLNGENVAVDTFNVATLYGMDSATNDYSTAGGTLAVTSGADKIALVSTYDPDGDNPTLSPKHYVKVDNGDGTYSFQRVGVGVTGMQYIDTDSDDYLVFQAQFRGPTDQTVSQTTNPADIGFKFNETTSWHNQDSGTATTFSDESVASYGVKIPTDADKLTIRALLGYGTYNSDKVTYADVAASKLIDNILELLDEAQ